MPTTSSLPSGQVVFDPRGTVTAATVASAPRCAGRSTWSVGLETLSGVRLGVLDNSKWNASKLLRRTVALLESDAAPSTINRYTKESWPPGTTVRPRMRPPPTASRVSRRPSCSTGSPPRMTSSSPP